MEFLPDSIRLRIPEIGTHERSPLDEMVVWVRYFDPGSNWRWYVMEYDGQQTFFGLIVCGTTAIVGHFNRVELEGLWCHDASLGLLGIERDSLFEPQTMAELATREPTVSELLSNATKPFPRGGGDLVQIDGLG